MCSVSAQDSFFNQCCIDSFEDCWVVSKGLLSCNKTLFVQRGCRWLERRILKTSLSPILCFNGRTPPFLPASTRIAPETFPSFIISLKRLIGLGSLTFCLAAGFRFCNVPASWKSSVSFPLNQRSGRRLSVL